jgi:hypothetical protein
VTWGERIKLPRPRPIEILLRGLAREEAERRAKEEAQRLAEEQADRKAREEAERKAQEEAARQAQQEDYRKALEETVRKGLEAERQAKAEADRRAKEEAEQRAQAEADRKFQKGSLMPSDAVLDLDSLRITREQEVVSTARGDYGIGLGADTSTRVIGPALVIDGDTLWIGGNEVRIHGIDAAETGQECQLPKGAWDSAMALDRKRLAAPRSTGSPVNCPTEAGSLA